MLYVIGGLVALVAILGFLLRWYVGRVTEQQREIEAQRKKLAMLDEKHKRVNEQLKKLKEIERKRREENAEIAGSHDHDVDDILNGLLSDDSEK